MRSTTRLATVLAVLFATHAASADTVTFQQIPGAQAANDMTPNGRYIVGMTPAFRAYRFDTFTNEMLLLPIQSQQAVAVSDDGSVIVGDIIDPKVNAAVAAMWTASSGVWTSLGYLPDALNCPSRSNAYELSADGTVVVGLSWDGCSGRGFRWTQETGMVELEPLANGGNRASVVSADGNVIGGFAQGSLSRTPAIWNGSAEGQLLDPPSGDAVGEVHGISGDGMVLLGEWNGDAVKWTGANMDRTVLGNGSVLPGWTGIAMDIADNGTIVGFDILTGNRRAWIQPNGTGPLIDLKSYIEGNGGTVPAGVSLEVCQAISKDGRKIIGHSFAAGAWLVTIEPACTADLAPPGGDGVVNVSDLLFLFANWGEAASNPADLSGDGVVNVSDLLILFANWGSCPGAMGACCFNGACSQLTSDECSAADGTYLGDHVPCSPTTCNFNDFCADAVDITDSINGAVVLGDNGPATPPFGDDPELPAGSPTCHWNQFPVAAHSTVWYSFTAPANGSVTIAVCSSSLPFSDSIIALFSGTCGDLVEIGCDDENCASPQFYSTLSANGLVPGQTYIFSVMNSGDWNGSVPGPFELIITSP